MQHRPFSVSHGLHTEGRVIVDELERRGKTADPQEKGCVTDGFHGGFHVAGGGVQENPAARTGQEFEKGDAYCGYQEAGCPGGPDRLLHPAAVSGSVVEGHNRQHPLAETDVDRVRNPLDLENNSDAGQNQVAVR